MNQFDSVDPKYKLAMEERIKEAKITKAEFERSNYLKPRISNFYFYAVPDSNSKEIVIVVTDRFGRKYSDTIKL